MLISVVSETNEIMEYDAKLKTREEVELPIEYVTEVYYLQIEYVKKGISEYKDILYVRSSENKAYFKEFKMGSEYTYDYNFDDN